MGRIDTNRQRLVASGLLTGDLGTTFTRSDLLDADMLPLMLKVLTTYGAEIEDALKENLIAEGKVASRSLLDSIRYNVYEIGSGKMVMELLLEDHYQYVNDGRVGKKSKGSVDKSKLVNPTKRGPKLPPFEPISKWIRYKGVKELSYKGLGFKTRQTNRVSDKLKKARLVDKIRWGIFNKGIEPTYFYKNVINDSLLKQISQDINISVGKSIELIISAK